jgi:hypothetical protein
MSERYSRCFELPNAEAAIGQVCESVISGADRNGRPGKRSRGRGDQGRTRLEQLAVTQAQLGELLLLLSRDAARQVRGAA